MKVVLSLFFLQSCHVATTATIMTTTPALKNGWFLVFLFSQDPGEGGFILFIQ
jgi:hypothetical protein